MKGTRTPIRHLLLLPTAAAVCALIAALLLGGCSHSVPLSDVGSSDATVWVRVTTATGEQIVGRLVSLDAGALVVSREYLLVGDVRIRERGGEPALYSGTERLPGELVGVESGEDGRVAVVNRTFNALEVDSVTFHRSSGERSLSHLLSLFVGPLVGGALGLLL